MHLTTFHMAIRNCNEQTVLQLHSKTNKTFIDHRLKCAHIDGDGDAMPTKGRESERSKEDVALSV